MPQPARCLLPDGVHLGKPGGRADPVQPGRVALAFQGGLKLGIPVEMILYRLLGTTRNQKDIS